MSQPPSEYVAIIAAEAARESIQEVCDEWARENSGRVNLTHFREGLEGVLEETVAELTPPIERVFRNSMTEIIATMPMQQVKAIFKAAFSAGMSDKIRADLNKLLQE
jgi:hypothetical protein